MSPTSSSLQRDGLRDFDFLHGCWDVAHRRLANHGGNEWTEFAGTADTRPVLGGLCNVEEHHIEGSDASGIALRCFDRNANDWLIYWVSERDGLLQPPVRGGFDGDIGLFEGHDTFNGQPIKVKFTWRKVSATRAQWEQAFSFDGGKSWETNWKMDFRRSGT